MNAKPIVVMYLPDHFRDSEWKAEEVMDILNNFPDGDQRYVRTDYWKDYYWLAFYKDEIDAPELQVFYEKDFTPIKFEELKQFIEDSLKKGKP